MRRLIALGETTMLTRLEIWVDITAARYLEALEALDWDTMGDIWIMARKDAALERALHELHDALWEEDLIQEYRTEA